MQYRLCRTAKKYKELLCGYFALRRSSWRPSNSQPASQPGAVAPSDVMFGRRRILLVERLIDRLATRPETWKVKKVSSSRKFPFFFLLGPFAIYTSGAEDKAEENKKIERQTEIEIERDNKRESFFSIHVNRVCQIQSRAWRIRRKGKTGKSWENKV